MPRRAASSRQLLLRRNECFPTNKFDVSGVAGLFLTYFTIGTEYTLNGFKRLLTLGTVAKAYSYIQSIIAEEGPFNGIIGFSQGPAVAACVVAHHAKTHPLRTAILLVSMRHIRMWFATLQIWRVSVLGAREKWLGHNSDRNTIGRKDQWFDEGLQLFAFMQCERPEDVQPRAGEFSREDGDRCNGRHNSINNNASWVLAIRQGRSGNFALLYSRPLEER